MSSFGEWKCSVCATVQHVPTEEHKQRRHARWPVGWRVVKLHAFAVVVCPRCALDSPTRSA